jgi:tRNA A37 threonylcarbamoyladenosine dehydratase
MVVPPEQFARIAGHVDFPLLQDKRVVIVGVGAVGSPIAAYLANSTVGFLRLIDPDILDIENPYRHALPVEYLGCNKAEALADYLSKQVEGLHVESVTRKIDQTVPGELLERGLPTPI